MVVPGKIGNFVILEIFSRLKIIYETILAFLGSNFD